MPNIWQVGWLVSGNSIYPRPRAWMDEETNEGGGPI